MPARKAQAKTIKSASKKENVLLGKEEKSSQSYINLIYGAVTVAVIFLLVFFGLKTFTQKNPGEITEEGVTTERTEEKDSGKTYTVKEGDTLWSIAEAELGSGYNWIDIKNSNDISDPANLEAGTTLTLPAKTDLKIAQNIENKEADTPTPTESAVTPAPSGPTEVQSGKTATPTRVQSSPTPLQQVGGETVQQRGEKITAREYIVKSGDNLWDISVRAYGDGYKWPELARVNNIQTPNLIYPNQKIQLPR